MIPNILHGSEHNHVLLAGFQHRVTPPINVSLEMVGSVSSRLIMMLCHFVGGVTRKNTWDQSLSGGRAARNGHGNLCRRFVTNILNGLRKKMVKRRKRNEPEYLYDNEYFGGGFNWNKK